MDGQNGKLDACQGLDYRLQCETRPKKRSSCMVAIKLILRAAADAHRVHHDTCKMSQVTNGCFPRLCALDSSTQTGFMLVGSAGRFAFPFLAFLASGLAQNPASPVACLFSAAEEQGSQVRQNRSCKQRGRRRETSLDKGHISGLLQFHLRVQP